MGIARLILAFLGAGLLLGACATPSERFNQRAEKAGLSVTVMKGDAFNHVAYWNPGAVSLVRGEAPETGSRLLHIYIGGDGTPWRGGKPTTDPTPRNPLLLRLIALDTNPAVYLGRPCFHGLAEVEPCNWTYWNDARYAEPVVASLTAAVNRLLDETKADGAVLLGASGGGALSVLVADRVPRVRGIVTIAGNLDLVAWLEYHEYNGLKESLNPATDGRRGHTQDRAYFEKHYAGGRDTTVPPSTVDAGLRSKSELTIIPDYDHNCCWSEIWPDILKSVSDLVNPVPAASGT